MFDARLTAIRAAAAVGLAIGRLVAQNETGGCGFRASGHWRLEVMLMKLRGTLTAVLLALALVASACTSRSATKPQTSSTAGRTSTSSHTSTAIDTPTATSSATEEADDRRAVEAAWSRFWLTYARITKISSANLPTVVGAVAVDPIRKQMIAGAAVARAAHKTDYGYVVNRPYWPRSIAGQSRATIGDCQDQSRYGSMSTVTGEKLTVGVARDNMRASLVRGADGAWRVQTIVYLQGTRC
jgi:hypothetical protein